MDSVQGKTVALTLPIYCCSTIHDVLATPPRRLRIDVVALYVLIVLLLMMPTTSRAFTLNNSSSGQYLNSSIEVLVDDMRHLSIDEVRSAAASGGFQSNGQRDKANFGYTHDAVWLHAFLVNDTDEQQWSLELAFATLDEVELFLIDTASGMVARSYRTGDTFPFAQRPIAHRHFVFPLDLSPHHTYELYMRVRSEGTVTVPLILWKSSSFTYASRNQYMANTLYFGLLLALLIYNLRLYLSFHDRVYLYYLGFIASIILAMGGWNGLFYEYLWPGSPRWGNLAPMLGYHLTGMFGAIFSRRFLNSRVFAPLLDRFMLYCTAAFAVLLVALPIMPYQVIAILTSAVGVCFSIAAIMSGLRSIERGQRWALYFLLAWGLLLIGTAILGARNFGLLPTNLLTLHAMQLGSAIETVLFTYALAERITDLRRSKEIAEERVMETKRKMIELLEHTESELESRVKERTHELTIINNRLKEQEQQLMGMALHDALTGLANRTLLDTRMSEALETAKLHATKVAVLLVDLDEFKPINDTYGHEMGDFVLQAIAERLRGVVRGSDTVARLGGDEFVIILPGLSGMPTAHSIGEAVIKALSRPIVIEQHALSVSASIGIAVYPDDGFDGATLLRHADKAMYRAKHNGRNQLCHFTEPATT